MPPRNHAYLAPSSATRWLNCPASPALEDLFPDEDTIYSVEGSLAHALAEERVKAEILNEPADIEQAIKNADDFYKSHPDELQENVPDMIRNVGGYIDFIQNQINYTISDPWTLLVEQNLDLNNWIPQGFGTSDIVLFQGSVLHIIDFKYGAGVPVPVQHNNQLMTYALGAYDNLANLFAAKDIDTIRMSIYQPRKGYSDTWEIPLSELLDWGQNVLSPGAKNAFSNVSDYQDGPWCRFCKARGRCSTTGLTVLHAEKTLSRYQLTPEQQSEILNRAPELLDTITAVKKDALNLLMEGTPVPGWKAVHGRANRRFDSSKKEEILRIAKDHDMNLEEIKLISPAKAEKQCGSKKEFQEILGAYVQQPEGAPTLAPETDKRQAIVPMIDSMKEMLDSMEKENPLTLADMQSSLNSVSSTDS